MKKSKVVALVAAALVAGLVLGSIGLASAAPAADTSATAGVAQGYRLRMGSAMRDAGARMVDILAKLTGLSEDDIYARRTAGESVADIAKSEGVETATVVDQALDARAAILDAKVADGTIDAETRDEVLARMTDRINERVNSTELGGGMGRGCGVGGGQGAMGGGRGAGACGSCTAPTE